MPLLLYPLLLLLLLLLLQLPMLHSMPLEHSHVWLLLHPAMLLLLQRPLQLCAVNCKASSILSKYKAAACVTLLIATSLPATIHMQQGIGGGMREGSHGSLLVK